mgnify:FL=1
MGIGASVARTATYGRVAVLGPSMRLSVVFAIRSIRMVDIMRLGDPSRMRRTWAMGIGASVARTVIYESISKMRETAMKPN